MQLCTLITKPKMGKSINSVMGVIIITAGHTVEVIGRVASGVTPGLKKTILFSTYTVVTMNRASQTVIVQTNWTNVTVVVLCETKQN